MADKVMEGATMLAVGLQKPGTTGRRCSRWCFSPVDHGSDAGQIRFDTWHGKPLSKTRGLNAKAFSANIKSNWTTISNEDAQKSGDVVTWLRSLCSGYAHLWKIRSSGLVIYMGAIKPPLYFREACRVSRTSSSIFASAMSCSLPLPLATFCASASWLRTASALKSSRG